MTKPHSRGAFCCPNTLPNGVLWISLRRRICMPKICRRIGIFCQSFPELRCHMPPDTTVPHTPPYESSSATRCVRVAPVGRQGTFERHPRSPAQILECFLTLDDTHSAHSSRLVRSQAGTSRDRHGPAISKVRYELHEDDAPFLRERQSMVNSECREISLARRLDGVASGSENRPDGGSRSRHSNQSPRDLRFGAS